MRAFCAYRLELESDGALLSSIQCVEVSAVRTGVFTCCIKDKGQGMVRSYFKW